MPSNSLSSRRKYLRRPKVCKSSPNPGRCHPPPPPDPPPPPPPWPATEFDFRLDWIQWPGPDPEPAFFVVRMYEDPVGGVYYGTTDDEFAVNNRVDVTVPIVKGGIYLDFYDPFILDCHLERWAFDLVLDVITPYTISVWDDKPLWLDSPVATFTF